MRHFLFCKIASCGCLIGLALALTSCEGNTRYEVRLFNLTTGGIRAQHRASAVRVRHGFLIGFFAAG